MSTRARHAPLPLAGKLLMTMLALMAMVGAGRYQWDTQVADNPQCQTGKPSALLRSETMAKVAMQCLGDIDLKAAERFASASLKRQAHNQLAMAVIASIFDLESASSKADAWMNAAALIGRRDYTVNSYWAARFLHNGDLPRAAQSIDAFFRAGWKDESVVDLARTLEANVRGREAFYSIAIEDVPWSRSYLVDVNLLSDSQLMNRQRLFMDAVALTAANRGIKPFATDLVLPAVSELYRRNLVREAYVLRRAYTPFDLQTLVNNSTFKASGLLLHSPFDWTLYHASGLDVSFDDSSADGCALVVRGDGSGRFRVASQTIRLLPGTYRLMVSGSTTVPMAGASSLVANLVPAVASSNTLQALQLPFPGERRPSVSTFTIAAPGPFFRFDLSLDAVNAGAGVDLRVDAVQIERLR